jgi:hypothetical protein
MLNPYKVIPAVQMQISEFRDARRSTVSDDSVLSDLWTSHNQHGIAITDISARLLPPLLGCIEQLQGSVNKLTSVVDTLALAAVAPAPSAKRTRGENVDDAARNTRLHSEIPQQWLCPPLSCTPSVFPPSLSVSTLSPPRRLCP